MLAPVGILSYFYLLRLAVSAVNHLPVTSLICTNSYIVLFPAFQLFHCTRSFLFANHLRDGLFKFTACRILKFISVNIFHLLPRYFYLLLFTALCRF